VKKNCLLLYLLFLIPVLFNTGCENSTEPETKSKTTISLDKQQIVFSQSLTAERVIILNRGNGELTWSVQSSPAWLVVSKTGGVITTADTLLLTINTTGLEYGDYEGTLTLSSSGGAATISLSFAYYAPAIKLSSDVIYFSRDYYTASIILENTGGSILTWSLSDIPAWLNVNKTGNSLYYSNVDYITFTVNFFNIIYGDYEQDIEIQSNGGNALITIHLYYEQVVEVYPGSGAARITLGAPLRDIKQIYGSPPQWSYTETPDHLYYHKIEYPERGLTFYFIPQSSSILIPSFPVESIYMVEPYDGLLETNLGIKSSRAEIINAYGAPDEDNQADQYITYNEGITFYFNENSRVRAILVFNPH